MSSYVKLSTSLDVLDVGGLPSSKWLNIVYRVDEKIVGEQAFKIGEIALPLELAEYETHYELREFITEGVYYLSYDGNTILYWNGASNEYTFDIEYGRDLWNSLQEMGFSCYNDLGNIVNKEVVS